MSLETQIQEIVNNYKVYQPKTPERVLELRAGTDVIIKIEKSIDMMQLRALNMRDSTHVYGIRLQCIKRLQQRHLRAIAHLFNLRNK